MPKFENEKLFVENYNVGGKFDYIENNPNAVWMPIEEFKSVTGITGNDSFTEYWKARDKFLERIRKAATAKDMTYGSYTFPTNPHIQNITENKSAWDILNEMTEKGKAGSIMAWDTETIGEFGHGKRAIDNDISGITEIAYSITKKGPGKPVNLSDPKMSFMFGIDESQKGYMDNIVSKMKSGERLTNTESWIAERMSRYSTIDHNGDVFKFAQKTLNINGHEQNMIVASSLNISRANSIEDVASGAEALHKIFMMQGGAEGRKNALNEVIQEMNHFSSGNNRLFAGFNLNYDYNVMDYMSKHYGVDALNKTAYIDPMEAVLGYNSIQGQSMTTTLGEMSKSRRPIGAFGRKSYGNLEAFMEALGFTDYSANAAHNAYEDSVAVLKVLESKDFDISFKGGYSALGEKNFQSTLDIGDNILIKSKGNVRSKDLLTINGQATTGYQPSNQYWTFEGLGTGNLDELQIDGKTVKESERRLIAKFSATKDKSNIMLYKTFDNEDDLRDFLKNHIRIEKEAPTDQQMALRKQLRDSDLARRQMNSFFQTGSVGKVGGKDVGGFEEFKRYYETYKRTKPAISEPDKLTIGQSEKLIEEDAGFRSLFNPTKQYQKDTITNAEAKAIRIHSNDTVQRISGVFSMFKENEEMFDLIYEQAGQGNNVTTQTIMARDMFEAYIKKAEEDGLIESKQIEYTIDDLNNVRLNGSNIDSSDIESAKRGIYNAYRKGNSTDTEIATNMKKAIDGLEGKGILSHEAARTIRNSSEAQFKDKPFALAESLAVGINQSLADVRDLGIEEFGNIVDVYNSLEGDPQRLKTTAMLFGLDESIISKAVSKNEGVFLQDSASSIYGTKLKAGAAKDIMTDDFVTEVKTIANNVNNNLNISGSTLRSGIQEELIAQGYSENAIIQFNNALNKNVDKAIEKAENELKNDLDRQVKEGSITTKQRNKILSDRKITSMFYATEEGSSDLLILTNQKNQKEIADTLSKLGEKTKPSEIKEAIKEKASFFEIPYLERFAVENPTGDDTIERITGYNGRRGHGPEVGIVRQGDFGYGRYTHASFDVYEDYHTGQLRGRITDPGEEYLTSVRRSADSAISAMMDENWERGNTILNRTNRDMMSESANIAQDGFRDAAGNVTKQHRMSGNDITRAFVLQMSPEDSMGTIEQINKFMSIYEENGANTRIHKAMQGIMQAFYEYNGLDNLSEVNWRVSDAAGIIKPGMFEEITKTEEFKQFTKQFMTSRAGSIGDADPIKRFIETYSTNTAAGTAKGELATSLRTVIGPNGKSLIGLLSDITGELSTGDKPPVSKELAGIYRTLAEADRNMSINGVVSESLSKTGAVYLGNITPETFSNNQAGSAIRPTYNQALNARVYYLSEVGDSSIRRKIEQTEDIHFGKLYSSSEELNLMSQLEKDLPLEEKAQTSIIGNIKSISELDLQKNIESGRQEAIARAKRAGLDENVMSMIYRDMASNPNLYEGKAYLRASIGNLDMMTLQDPKVVKMEGLQAIESTGTNEEKMFMSEQLRKYRGRQLKTGTLLGSYNGREIAYKGPDTILTDEMIEGWKFDGRADVLPSERQASDIKLQAGLEKATAETLDYKEYQALKAAENNRVARQIARFSYDDLALYTDIADDIFMGDNNGIRTTAIFNNNVFKHLSDTSIESGWNILFDVYAQDNRLEELSYYLNNAAKDITGESGDFFKFNADYNRIEVINSTRGNRVNLLEDIYSMIEKDLSSFGDAELNNKALKTIAMFKENNMAKVGIQRNVMNIYEGSTFKMDSRAYQTMIMQGENNYTRGLGKEYADMLIEKIESGEYDQLRYNGPDFMRAYNAGWKAEVRGRRGILSPKNGRDTLKGIQESLAYLSGAATPGNNIVNVDLTALLEKIPTSGKNTIDYGDLIFKVDGQYSDFIKGLAKQQEVDLKTASNVFRINLKGYDIKLIEKENGKEVERAITDILLPYQYLNSVGTDEEVFLSSGAKSTAKFLNTLAKYKNGAEDARGEINAAFNEMISSFKGELDVHDKNSLAARTSLQMRMPNSAGGLAIDAVTPYVDVQNEYNRFKQIEKEISEKIQKGERLTKEDLNLIQAAEKEYKDAISNKISGNFDILRNADGEIERMGDSMRMGGHIKFGNDKYHMIMTNAGGSLQNSIVMGREMFKATQMDPGHIGLQIMNDFMEHGNIDRFDNFDHITRRTYEVDDRLIYNLRRRIRKEFENTEWENWSVKMADALDDIMLFPEADLDDFWKVLTEGKSIKKIKIGKKEETQVFDSYSRGLKEILQDSINAFGDADEISKARTKSLQMDLVRHINNVFEEIGEDYLSKVGVLGEAGRYPFFHEGAIVPARFFLDKSVKGRGLKFLGPQFSVLQNLDFDGDNEFIHLFGNAGLTEMFEEDGTLTKEGALFRSRFVEANKKSTSIMHKFLEDGEFLKDYNYQDSNLFRFKLLQDVASKDFDKTTGIFMSSLDDESKTIFSELNDSTQEYIMANSSSFKNMYRQYDKNFGNFLSNPEAVRAAIQARVGKEYIGNYSKVNFNIRETLTYLLNRVEEGSEQEDQLLKIRNAIAYIDNEGPNGLLTILEQKGIDTKHVHDASRLNSSSSWREGVTKLFTKNALNPNSDVTKIHPEEYMEQMVLGSRRIILDDDEVLKGLSNLEIAKQVINASSMDDFTHEGMKSLRAIYELSQFNLENGIDAFTGFVGVTKKAQYMTAMEITNRLGRETGEGVPADFASRLIAYLRNTPETDDSLRYGNKLIKEGGILSAFEDDGSTIGLVFDRKKGNKAIFKEYDFVKGELTGQTRTFSGDTNHIINQKIADGLDDEFVKEKIEELDITIEDINNSVAEGNGIIQGRTRISDDFYNVENNRLFNIKDIKAEDAFSDTANIATNKSIRKAALQSTGEEFLNEIVDTALNGSDDDFAKIWNKYQGVDLGIYGSNRQDRFIMSEIVGDDALAFREKTIDIHERLEGLKQKGAVRGEYTPTDLIRAMNNDIARNPRQSAGRFENIKTFFGDHTEYFKAASVLDEASTEDFTSGINNYKRFNAAIENMNEEVSNALDSTGESLLDLSQRAKDEDLAEDFVESERKKIINAFKETKESSVSSRMADIYTNIKTKDAITDILNWDKIVSEMNIETGEYKLNRNMLAGISDGAKIGYGVYTGININELSYEQLEIVRKELEKINTENLEKSEKIVYDITVDILNDSRSYSSSLPTTGLEGFIDYSDGELIKQSAKRAEEKAENIGFEGFEDFKNQMWEEAVNITEEENKKKTIRNSLNLKDKFKSFKEGLSDGAKKKIKIGGAIAGGLMGLNMITHAIRNTSGSDDASVPKFSEADTKVDYSENSGETGLKYKNAPSDAQQVSTPKQRMVAPPTPKFNRRVYHDSNTGLSLRVSAQSAKKLSEESYNNINRAIGASKGTVNVNKDNSKITDNWLDRKFSELTE